MVKYTWEIHSKIWKIIYTCNNKEIIKNVLEHAGDNNIFEGKIGEYSDVYASEISNEFKEVLKTMKIAPKNMTGYLTENEKLSFTIIPSKLYKSITHELTDNNKANKFKIGINGEIYRELKLSNIQEATLKEVYNFCKESSFLEPFEYDIIIGIFDNKNVLGYADTNDNKIVISNIAFENGAQNVLETLIEEYIHLKYKVNDETREMQDALIKEMVKIMKLKNAYVL